MGKFIDLTGEKFNKLTVIKKNGSPANRRIQWECLCDCGKLTNVDTYSLHADKIKSCGCLQKEYASKGQVINLVGKTFGRLTVIKMKDRIKGEDIKWICQCDCGNKAVITGRHLSSNHTKSCGCIAKEVVIKRNTSHGKSKTKLYSVWCGIIARCFNENTTQYKDYGGRGISVCDEWRNDFEQFAKDMGTCPKGMSIDRKDNNGNYSKDNCRWATKEQQANNTSRNINIEYNSKNQTLSQWAKETSIAYYTLLYRYYAGDRGDRLFRKLDHEFGGNASVNFKEVI